MLTSSKKNLLWLIGGVGVVVLILSVINLEFNSFQQIKEEPSYSDFSARWIFEATLDQIVYHLGDKISLSVNLTCLKSHTITNYFPDLVGSLQLFNGTEYLVWSPPVAPGFIYLTYEFNAGDTLGGTYLLTLGATNSSLNQGSIDRLWIPPLQSGSYSLKVGLPPGLLYPDEELQEISLSFDIS